MYRVVLDTNIIVSAVISTQGNPAQILNMVLDRKHIMHYSSDILAEYKRVLAKPKLGIGATAQTGIIEAIIEAGVLVIPTKSDMPLPDESDRVFYDAANTCDGILITGNIKHYPSEPHVMTPTSFLAMH